MGVTETLPDFAPVPHSALGPTLNEQGYYVGRVERNLYWVTDGTYQCAFLTTSDGVVVLDSGSLTLVCAQAMPKDRALAVVTNNLPAAQYLAECDNLRIFTLPGTIRGLTSAAVDVWTGRRLNTLTVDLAIIGVNGMTPTHGLTTTNPEEAATKRAMLLSARRRVVPVISGRIGRNSFCSFAAINEVDLVITDAAANPEIVTELAASGPEVVIAT